MEVALTKEVSPGLKVQRGEDGHWIWMKLTSGQSAGINVEATVKPAFAKDIICAWIDEHLDGST